MHRAKNKHEVVWRDYSAPLESHTGLRSTAASKGDLSGLFSREPYFFRGQSNWRHGTLWRPTLPVGLRGSDRTLLRRRS